MGQGSCKIWCGFSRARCLKSARASVRRKALLPCWRAATGRRPVRPCRRKACFWFPWITVISLTLFEKQLYKRFNDNYMNFFVPKNKCFYSGPLHTISQCKMSVFDFQRVFLTGEQFDSRNNVFVSVIYACINYTNRQ